MTPRRRWPFAMLLIACALSAWAVRDLLHELAASESDLTVVLSREQWVALSNGPHASGALAETPTVVVFSDYQCPACATWNRFLDEFVAGVQPTVRIVWRHFPLQSIHPQAFDAARAAECGGEQGLFNELKTGLYREQSALGRKAWRDFAGATPLDHQRFEGCMSSPQAAEAVRADISLGLAIGVTATPTFIIDGQLYRRPPSLERLRQLVNVDSRQVMR